MGANEHEVDVHEVETGLRYTRACHADHAYREDPFLQHASPLSSVTVVIDVSESGGHYRHRIAMPSPLAPEIESFIRRCPIGRLATADAQGQPSVVPVCFVLVDGHIYSPIDDKRKRVSWGRLKRLRNIEENPAVSLLLDHYSNDWMSLRWVLIRGAAETVEPRGRFAHEHAAAIERLRAKYPQYEQSGIDQRPLIKIVPHHVSNWSAS